MGKYPILKPRKVAAILNTLGFVKVRQRGSHIQYRHSDGRCTTIPFHKSEELKQDVEIPKYRASYNYVKILYRTKAKEKYSGIF